MKRGFVVAVAGAAVVIAGLSGCSKDSDTSGETTTAKVNGGEVASSQGKAKVTIDGKDQNIQGTVTCVTAGGNVTIGIGDAATAIGATLTEGDSPTVNTVGLGNLNGVTLGYTAGTGQGNAEAKKDGKTYTISGTATGVDMANPMQPVNKPFEIEVTCP